MKLKALLNTICFFCVCCFAIGTVKAQNAFSKRATGSIGEAPQPGKVLNDASLDNVDFQNGTLRVGLPLHQINIDGINVPISLNYSALGLKVGQAAGCVGMGWELNAGGKITTNVNGTPDTGPNGLGNMGAGNPMLSLSGSSLNVESDTTARGFALRALNNHADGAWDVYSYSTPHNSGKFMLTGGNKLTFPYNPLITINSGYSISTG